MNQHYLSLDYKKIHLQLGWIFQINDYRDPDITFLEFYNKKRFQLPLLFYFKVEIPLVD